MTDQKSQQVIVEEETDRSRLAAIHALALSAIAAEQEFEAHGVGSSLHVTTWKNEDTGETIYSDLHAVDRRCNAIYVLRLEIEAAIKAGTFTRINNGEPLT